MSNQKELTSFRPTLNQKDILLSLIQGKAGTEWASTNEGWKPDAKYDVCYWEGIQCDTGEIVTAIILNDKKLTGSLPEEIGDLTSLRELRLANNDFRGWIPLSIANLPSLEVLDLTNNHFEGPFPSMVSSPSLTVLDLSFNVLTGTLPQNIGSWNPLLKVLDLTNNRIRGKIPTTFNLMDSLDTLSLTENSFTGTIPGTLGSSKMLKFLYLDGNNLVGTIPPRLSHQESVMEELWLQNNQLSGTIPAALADIEKLVNFFIDGNKFTGTVPEEICSENLNPDFFEGTDKDIKRNFCEAIACPVGHVSFDGLFPCHPCKEKYFNPYLGRVGKCIDLDPAFILRTFYTSTRGSNWLNMSVGWDATEDYCTFTGITCDDKKNVVAIELKNKGLQGTIPPEIGFLSHLSVLDLSENMLSGVLPSDLRWAPLKIIDISQNMLDGMVPFSLCVKAGINGNGADGDNYNCDNVACPVGSYSYSGHGTNLVDRDDCRECDLESISYHPHYSQMGDWKWDDDTEASSVCRSCRQECIRCEDGKSDFLASKNCFALNDVQGSPDSSVNSTVVTFWLGIVPVLMIFMFFIHREMESDRIREQAFEKQLPFDEQIEFEDDADDYDKEDDDAMVEMDLQEKKEYVELTSSVKSHARRNKRRSCLKETALELI